MLEPRAILHVDMDAFFAAVEQLDRPELRGKPVLIGSDRPRGVVATASYEARPYGCHSAQPMAIAKRLCPHAVIVYPRGRRYSEVSQQIFSIFEDFTDRIEPLSIDEAFLDLTGSARLLGPPEEVARRIRQRIQEEVGLTASIGVAPNKFLAKLASDMHKPDGLTIIPPDRIDAVLAPLPIGRLWGVGPATENTCHRHGIRTIGDLRRFTPAQLAHLLGSAGPHFHRLAHGLDDRDVTPDSQAKSIGQEQTFETDLDHPDNVRAVLLGQVEQVGFRLRRHDMLARSIALKIRFGEFQTISRSGTLDAPTDQTAALWEAARTLFDRWADMSFTPVRLIGFAAGRLTGKSGQQMDLFADPADQRQGQIDAAMDRINARFGKATIHRGASLPRTSRG